MIKNAFPAIAHRPLPKIKFRILIIGRANAGKTSILQRVCDTTDSVVYRQTGNRREVVRASRLTFLYPFNYGYTPTGST